PGLDIRFRLLLTPFALSSFRAFTFSIPTVRSFLGWVLGIGGARCSGSRLGDATSSAFRIGLEAKPRLVLDRASTHVACLRRGGISHFRSEMSEPWEFRTPNTEHRTPNAYFARRTMNVFRSVCR